MSNLVFFGLGGTGIRVAEALIHLCGLGLGPRRLRLFLIDPDQGNDAARRVTTLLDAYSRARRRFENPTDGFLGTSVENVLGQATVWSPISDPDSGADATFRYRVGRAQMSVRGAESLAAAADLLFSQEIQSVDMREGFRGMPTMGTVFMNRLRQAPELRQILNGALQEKDAVVFAAGSVFGGTGAAALPVVGRVLRDGIRGGSDVEVSGMSAERLGAALILPFFSLPSPETGDPMNAGPRPHHELFPQNTAAALPTYVKGEAGYGTYYVLGDSHPRVQPRYKAGGSEQRNPAHPIELMAALAARDFVGGGGKSVSGDDPVFRGMGVSDSSITLRDLPIEGDHDQLLGALTAMHTYLTVFRPDGRSRPELPTLLRGATWIEELRFSPHLFTAAAETFDDLGTLWMQTWRWLHELHSAPSGTNLRIARTAEQPSAVPLDGLFPGHRHLGRLTPNGFEVFRDWNDASRTVWSGSANIASFLPTMRQGSAAYAKRQFMPLTRSQG